MDTSTVENVIRSLVKELITEEKIEEIFKEEIHEQLEYHFDRALASEAEKMVRKFCDDLITRKLDEVLGQRVLVNDGFGSRKEYADFNTFVTNYIGMQVKSSYDLERKVANMVRDRLDKYCKEVVAESNNELANKVIEKIAADKGKHF